MRQRWRAGKGGTEQVAEEDKETGEGREKEGGGDYKIL